MSDSLSQADHIDEGRLVDASRFELIIRHSDWKDERLRALQLEEKLRSYAAFVRDGFLFRLKPEAEDAAVWVLIESQKKLPSELQIMAERVVSESSPYLAGLEISSD